MRRGGVLAGGREPACEFLAGGTALGCLPGGHRLERWLGLLRAGADVGADGPREDVLGTVGAGVPGDDCLVAVRAFAVVAELHVGFGVALAALDPAVCQLDVT
jgi:hypothetical protein